MSKQDIQFEGDVDEIEVARRQHELAALVRHKAEPTQRETVAVVLSSGITVDLPLVSDFSSDFVLTTTKPTHLVEAMRTPEGGWWDHGPATLGDLCSLLNLERVAHNEARAAQITPPS